MIQALSRRVCLSGLAGALLLPSWSGNAYASDDSLSSLKKAGSIRIGTSGSAPPYTGVDPHNQLTGYDIAWGNLIGAALGLHVDWVKSDFRGLMTALQAGQVDALMSGIRITPKRETVFAFSVPYSYEATVAVAPSTNTTLKSFADVAHHDVAVVAGSFQEQITRATPGVSSVMALPGASDVFMSLRTGHAEIAVLGMSAITHYQQAGNTDMRIVGEGAAPMAQGVVLRHDAIALKSAIDAVIKAKVADGTYDRLYWQYFHVAPPSVG